MNYNFRDSHGVTRANFPLMILQQFTKNVKEDIRTLYVQLKLGPGDKPEFLYYAKVRQECSRQNGILF